MVKCLACEEVFLLPKDARTVRVDNDTAIPSYSGQPAVQSYTNLQATSQVVDGKKALFEAIGSGAFAGCLAGWASHQFAGGKLTLPIWIIVYLLVLATVRRKLVATAVFLAVGPLVNVLLERD